MQPFVYEGKSNPLKWASHMTAPPFTAAAAAKPHLFTCTNRAHACKDGLLCVRRQILFLSEKGKTNQSGQIGKKKQKGKKIIRCTDREKLTLSNNC